MKELAAKGHQADVYGHFPLKTPIPNYTDSSLIETVLNLISNIFLLLFFYIVDKNI